LPVSENGATESQDKDTPISENNKENEEKSSENGLRFHAVPDEESGENSPSPSISPELDKKINTLIFRLREALEDRYLAVKHALDLLREKGVEIKDHNDFYLQATHQAGKSDAQLTFYNEQYQKPLNETINKFEKRGFSLREVENYAIFKHGLERNGYMSQKDINEGKKPRKDYAGVLTVEKETGKSAQEYIDAFEKRAGKELVDELWQRTHAATEFSLNKLLESGLINKSLFDELKGRYKYYIPLRGHDATTAEDRWNYSPDTGTYFSNPLIRADGRASRSETPFAYILQMAQSAIASANKNSLNQTLLRLSRLDNTGLLTANRTWYVNGEAQEAEYSENADVYRENIERFEAEMEELEKKGLAERGKKRLDIGNMFIKPSQKEQHAIHVFQNGKAYTVYVNGNPAVSRAVNGLNLYEQNKDYGRIAEAARWMAANMTTRSPLFVVSNFSRDYLFTSSILGVKEDAKYARQFQRNIPEATTALYRYIAGKPNMNKASDRYMLEYIMNGAKTGFFHLVNLQKIQKQVERDIKKGNRKNMLNYLSDAVGNMNDFAENLSRFSVYVTSRKQGRSIQQAVSDAKEVTVNFNRQGAGGYGAAWMRPLYLFLNAGVQALSNFSKVAVKHPWKTSALLAVYTASGSTLAPFLASLLGGDDGWDEYWRLSDWDRQNNLCIYTGKGFIKIPLPHELRVFHALGDNLAQALLGKKTGGDAFLDSITGFADLIPNGPAVPFATALKDLATKGFGEASKTALTGLPDVFKPFAQLAVNRDFKGSPIVNPWAKKTLP
jgi:hypothetical protein